jgi:hypothetical protein
MSKLHWNTKSIIFLLFLLDIGISFLYPGKTWANTVESSPSTSTSASDVFSQISQEALDDGTYPGKTSANTVESSPSSSDVFSQISQEALDDGTTPPQNDADAEPVNSVSQLTDVKPSDWAFQALQSLVERYGCIDGYPNNTYRGNHAISRYEFAAGLNACLHKVNELIASNQADLVQKGDLTTLHKLQEQFAAELATLRGRVDQLETRTAQLENQRFSTTTTLRGQVETVIGGIVAGNNINTQQPAPKIFTFQDDLTLYVTTSFSGTDQLRILLGADNIQGVGSTPATTPPSGGIFGTNDGRTSDNASTSFPSNQVYVSGLRYKFQPFKGTQVNIFPASDGAFEIGLSGPINPYFEGSAANGISRYSRRNMVYDYGDTGSGVAVLQQLGKQVQLGLEYTSLNGNNPADYNGLFTGRYVALGQLSFYTPSKNFRIAFTYTNTYSPPSNSGGAGLTYGTNFGPVIGSNLANSTIATAGTVANIYGIEAFYHIVPKFAVNGWVGYAVDQYLGYGNGEVWDWGTGLSFPDLFKKSSLGGIFVGMEPRLAELSKNVNLGNGYGQADKGVSLHIEAFYQYQLSDHIAITPGVIWITSPDYGDISPNTPSDVIAWLRTTFRF